MYYPLYYPALVTPRVRLAPVMAAPVVPVMAAPVAPVVVPTVPAAPVYPVAPPRPSPYLLSPRGPPLPRNFHLEGILRNGEFRTVHMRDPDFGVLPDHLNEELMSTYGRYPFTDVRISTVGGRYQIDAMPRSLDDSDTYWENYPPEMRMIGFNEVRGHARERTVRRHRKRYL